MSYRDEEPGLRQRVGELEGELESARETIARLQGESAAAQVGEDKPSWFVGAPTRMSIKRELPFAVTEAGFEAMAELLRARLPAQGQVSQVGRTLSYRLHGTELRVSRVGKDRTQLRLVADHRGASIGIGASLPGLTLIASAPIGAALESYGQSPAYWLAALPFVAGAAFLGLRALFGRGVKNDRKKLTGVFEGIAELAAQHAVTNLRVESSPAGEAATDAAAEAEAAELEAVNAAEEQNAAP